MKINMSRIAGEWRMWLRHLAPLKARSSISLYPRSSLSPGSPLYIPGNWDLYKMRRMVPLKMFDSRHSSPARQSHGAGMGQKGSSGSHWFSDISHILERRAGSDWENLIGFRFRFWLKWSLISQVRVGFLFPVTFINQSVFSTQWMIKDILKLEKIKTKFLFWWFSLYDQSSEDYNQSEMDQD